MTSEPVMPGPEAPKGQRFSHVYVERGRAVSDSKRMRSRLASMIRGNKELGDLSKLAELELGIQAPWTSAQSWQYFLERWALQDVLDLITLAYRQLLIEKKASRYVKADYERQWVAEVNRVLMEENVHYEVDDRGGVHFCYDEEFSRNSAATISALTSIRYANVLNSYNDAMTRLAAAPPQAKEAIRSLFGAVEGLFKLVSPNADRLGTKEAEELQTKFQKLYAADATAQRVASKVLAGFKDWIDAAHFYRHEQGAADEVAQPPLGLAVHLISTGASHIRWLAELDAAASR